MRILVWLTHKDVGCWNFSSRNIIRLQSGVPGVDVKICQNETEFLTALPTASVALVWRFKQEWFEHAPWLRWIATPAAGRDYFSITPPANVRVTYGRFHGELIAETVLGMMLSMARGVLPAVWAQHHGETWPRAELAANIRTLRGAHVIVVGFGSIGEWVARYAKTMGTRITGIRRSAVPTPSYFSRHDRITTPDELDAILPTADHVVLALPSDTGTDLLFNAARIAKLPKHACIYNIGRGNSLDEAALVEALTEKRLAGACLDVFNEEPLPPESHLRQAPNVVLMPHVAACGEQYLSMFVDEFITQWRATDKSFTSPPHA